VVLGLPRIDAIGKYWESDLQTPFCSIGDPGRLWVLLPVGPADYRVLQEDREEARNHQAELEAAIRVRGRVGRTWAGKVAQLPGSEAREVPLPLTQKGGGPLPAKPGDSPSTYVPLSQHYLVAVTLLDPDGAVYPGTLAPVLIHCRWRTAAWWLWRTLAATFDLELV
jgi:putative peptide zinc metalloprotease protein